jgi:3,4-dihydroxy 2-butanone 4-phosphate synthase/GTP cyclohydrolase II
MAVARIEEVIRDIRAGKMIILVDDEDRENEGDLCMAAEAVTPEAINFMARFGRGLICLTLDRAQVKRHEPGLPPAFRRQTGPGPSRLRRVPLQSRKTS